MTQQSLHRQKKPFQPSITSFFGRVDRDEYEQLLAREPAQPVLEPSIQSDLLNVGMRIRKAVPEGYKTHKTMLFQDSTPARVNSCQSTTTPELATRRAELLPFCGLHKVGGLRMQDTWTPVDSYQPVDIFADESMPFSLSQESNASTVSMDSMPAAPMLNPLTSHKRRHLDEEEDEDIPPFQLHFSDPFDPVLAGLSITTTSAIFPTSYTSIGSIPTKSARPMAKPRTRRKGSAMAVQPMDTFDVEFEEAPFLQPWDEGEIEMGGM